MCFCIIIMIFIGGLTRLTHSGLSITEWQPITGIIPPLNEGSWQIEFAKYKSSPEFIKINFHINFEEFKSIYLMEFFHRLAGRITGLLYIIPLCILLLKRYITIRESGIYFLALFLLCGQGFMGWYMVKSGLISNPHVSHYRLAMHLMLAVLLYIIMVWQLLKNSATFILLHSNTSIIAPRFWGKIAILLLLLQMILGAFVAGLNAGLVYNSFPLMGNAFIPDEILRLPIKYSVFSDPVYVQFLHRILAYILSLVIIVFAVFGFKLDNNKLSKALCYLLVILLLQVIAGIATLIYQVPIMIALLHQLGSIILLSSLLWSYFLLTTAE